ncbi:hypothetical protein CXF59_12290 [Flavobacterium sp. ALD4]|uniref:hypothetical protein n=1 Tax=Flavobacterium sp. ALD4 TaxID=2058314 RepID=UPI000C34FC1E|nr:hypothetical protein [Flavobacterium sp. ALD4]PKH66698.1 hypothetical protein CXF59_12290 [Flavobacterium sp. ALD4]
MFGFAKKIKEYSKLGSAMNELNRQLDLLGNHIENSTFPSDFDENVIGLTFIIRNEILNRMDEYNWNMEGPILVASIHSRNITLLEAYSVIITKTRNLSLQLEPMVQKGVEDILAKGEAYYELERISRK